MVKYSRRNQTKTLKKKVMKGRTKFYIVLGIYILYNILIAIYKHWGINTLIVTLVVLLLLWEKTAYMIRDNAKFYDKKIPLYSKISIFYRLYKILGFIWNFIKNKFNPFLDKLFGD